MIKILITDDHPVVRRGIKQILEEDESIRIIDEASDGKELVQKIVSEEYDVVLLEKLKLKTTADLIRYSILEELKGEQ